MTMAGGFPIVLDVAGRRCLVIGAGREADDKAAALQNGGALVERCERYTPGMLGGYFLAVAADPDRSRNAEIFAEAERAGVLVNCLDDPSHCRFIFPSILRQGELSVAISTGGACPALAVRLKERLQRELGPEYAQLLEMARAARAELAQKVPDFAARRRRWYALADSQALDLLRQGRGEEARSLLRAILFGEELP
jgi:siroheme synthase-like protein